MVNERSKELSSHTFWNRSDLSARFWRSTRQRMRRAAQAVNSSGGHYSPSSAAPALTRVGYGLVRRRDEAIIRPTGPLRPEPDSVQRVELRVKRSLHISYRRLPSLPAPARRA